MINTSLVDISRFASKFILIIIVSLLFPTHRKECDLKVLFSIFYFHSTRRIVNYSDPKMNTHLFTLNVIAFCTVNSSLHDIDNRGSK